MRVFLALLLLFQLFVRSVAAPHAHAHESAEGSAAHAARPHLHLAGHAHDHAAQPRQSRVAHRYSPGDRHGDDPQFDESSSSKPDSGSSEHDHDAVYLVDEMASLGANAARFLQATADSSVACASRCATLTDVTARAPRSGEQPDEGVPYHLAQLPHFLRI